MVVWWNFGGLSLCRAEFIIGNSKYLCSISLITALAPGCVCACVWWWWLWWWWWWGDLLRRRQGPVYIFLLQWRHNERDGVSNHQPLDSIVYSIVYSGADQRKHQISASLAFVWGIHRWPVNSPHKGPVTRKMLPFDDVIMLQGLYHCSRRRRDPWGINGCGTELIQPVYSYFDTYYSDVTWAL